jgi:transcriptional regulator with XRE-family HTH domain
MEQMSDRLVRTMRQRGINQAHLAAQLGVTAAAVSSWTKGTKQPSSQHLGPLAVALGVDIDFLVRGEGDGLDPAALEAERAEYLESIDWYFRPEPPDRGRNYGDAAEFAFREGLRVLARECAQNTSDAKLDTESTALIEFAVIEVTGSHLDRFLKTIRWDKLRPRLEAAASHVDRAQAAQAIQPGIEAIDEGRLMLLRVADYWTTGLTGDEFGSSKFVAVMRNTLDSDKGETAGGSYGLGKATMWASSRFGLVLAASNLAEPYEDRRLRRTIGRAELPWHELDGGGCFAGPGWLGFWNESGSCTVSGWENAALAHDLFLDRPDSSTGTSFLIVAAHDTSGEASSLEEFTTELEIGAATSFWPAMVAAEGEEPRLNVRVRAFRNEEMVLDRDVDPRDHVPARVNMLSRYYAGDVAENLEQEGDVVVRPVILQVPPRKVNPDPHPTKEHDALLLVSRADELEDSPEGVGVVAFMRGTRMIVKEVPVRGLPVGALAFRAVVLAGEAAGDDEDSIIAERFMRAAEPPEHNNWAVTRKVTDAYPRGGKTALDEFYRRVNTEIRALVKSVEESKSDGPDSLRELLRLKPPIVQREKKPRVKAASGELHPDGSWSISATITLPRRDDGRRWVFQPVLRFASQSGAPVSVKWQELRPVSHCSVEGVSVRANTKAITVKVEGETDPSSHPVGGSFSAVQLDIRNYRGEV